MPLYQRRRRQQEKAERATRGEAIPLTTGFSKQARTGLLHAIMDNHPKGIDIPEPDEDAFLIIMHHILTRDWETLTLTGEGERAQDVRMLIAAKGTAGQLVDSIEAVFIAFDIVKSTHQYSALAADLKREQAFRERINEILDDHDLAYQVVGMKVVPRDSMVMHADVVAPAFSLLHGDARLEKVEKAFQDALSELKPGGNPADAITDAATALQEMLTVLGAEGNALGPLLASARKRGLLGPHDSKLAEGVERIGHWVSAERNTRGDAHAVTDASRDDAWLAVHVVGALILRLEKGPR